MAAKQNNCGKGSKPSNAQSRFSVPLKRKADEPLNTKDNDANISHLSATNLFSPSTLSHFSSVNHSKDKPVDNIDNHSIQGHPCQNYETKDISLTCNQPIEVKHVSYDTPSMLRSHLHSNHSMDSSPNYHSNYSVDKLASHEDTNSIRDVQGKSNDLFSYKGIQTQNGIKTWDEDVLRVQNNGEELKRASSHASVQMNQKSKGRLHSSRTRRQLIKTFDASAHQTTSSPIYESVETFVACNSQGDSSFCTESINTGSMIPSQSRTYREHPTDQTTDGNVSPPCNKNNFTDDKQLPKCGETEEKQAAVREIYICSICEKEFRQSGNFHNHMKSHTESLHYCKCGNCGSEFDNDENLLQHMQKEHTGSNPYKCQLCVREFRQFNNLRRHLRSHREKIFTCEFCEQKFNEEYYLDMHMGSHTGHRLFSCGVCAEQFRSISDLKEHVNTHPKSELYVCEVCGKGFSKACVRRQHMKKHDGKRPYSCKLCHKSYIHAHHLNMHMRTHTKSKPFPCKLCNKEFSQISHFNKHQKQHLVEVSLSVSSPEESNSPEEKMINTLLNNSIPDELNVVLSNLQQKPKAKPVRKRSKGPRKKAVSTTSPAYLIHASLISEANQNPYDSSDSGTFGPISNEATQNVMKEMMYFPLPDHLTHQNPMYMSSFAPAFSAAHCTNLNMMKYQTHNGNGLQNDYAQDKSFLHRTPLSYESPKPLSHTRDFSHTVKSARSTPVSSASINKEHKQYFYYSTFAKPVEFLNCNMPVPVNGPFDFLLPTTQNRGNMDFEMGEKMLNCLDLSRSTGMRDRKLENYRKMKVKDEKLEELEDQAEGEPFEAFQRETFSCHKQQIEVRERIEHEINKTTDDDEDEEEGRLIIVEQDPEEPEIQEHNSKISTAEMTELQKRCSVVCQNEKTFSQRMCHDLKNTIRRDTLQRSQIGSICCNKSVVCGDCNHGSYEEEVNQQGQQQGQQWANNFETSRSHTVVQTNSPFDILQQIATLPYQRVVNDCKDSSGIVLDMSLKRSPTEHRQPGSEKSTVPACLTPMNTDFNNFEHLDGRRQRYQLHIAKKQRKSASSPSEETVPKCAKKYACQEMQDEIYVSERDLEEPIDLTKPSFKKKPS